MAIRIGFDFAAICLTGVSNRVQLVAVNTFQKSDEFDDWLLGLKDPLGKAQAALRLDRAARGNFGDCEPVGDGVSEMRIHYGPGYHSYFTRRGTVVYLLLLGGDKSTQKRDIKRAVAMASALPKD